MGLGPDSPAGRLFDFEPKLRGQPWGSHEPPRVGIEDIGRGYADEFSLRVGHAVQRVNHREDAAVVVERDGHGVQGEVAAPKVVVDGPVDGCYVYQGLAGAGRQGDPDNAP